jgi:hypothetical protein
MIIITYFFSFLFESEAAAQNFLILFNLVFGSLGSTVVIMLRSLEQSTDAAKIAAYILRIIPSFAFGYGFDLLLNGKLIMFIDYSIDYINKPNSLKISLEYTGSDALFLGCTFVFYLILLIIIELYYYSFSEVEDGLIDQNNYKNLDKNVQNEIYKVNGKDIVNTNEKQNDENLEENRMHNNKIILNDFNYFDDMNSVEKINYQLNEDKSRNKNNQNVVYNSGNELISENQEGNYKNINKSDYPRSPRLFLPL